MIMKSISSIMKKQLSNFFKLWFSMTEFILKTIGKPQKKCLLIAICRALESMYGKEYYFSVRMKPRDTLKRPFPKGMNQDECLAIVLQGPICREDDITLNSIRFYKQMYPFANIIVSTWDDESEDILIQLRKEGATILKNKKPEKAGTLNVNLQLTSSLAGIEEAERLECKYVVKTRTDQCISRPFIFNHMVSLLKIFPSADIKKQEGRLIALSRYTGDMFSPYMLSDFMFFGITQDVKKMMSAPLDDRPSFGDRKILSRREQAEEMYPPEVYLMKHYLRDYAGLECADTIKAYWKAVKDYFICLDSAYVDLLWRKYETKYEYHIENNEFYDMDDADGFFATMTFSFVNWFNLYSGDIHYDEAYENIADLPPYMHGT